MSLQYIIDGYNAIYKIPSLKDRSLQEAREGLIRFIKDNALCGSAKNKVTVVFDGKADVVAGLDYNSLKESGIKVIFTRDETADDKIKKLVDEYSNPKQVVVVTDDRDILYYSRAAGAAVVSVKEWSSRRPAVRHTSDGAFKSQTDVRASDTITEELKKLWL